MSNHDPYAPPATRENDPADGRGSGKDTILRRLGALSLGYVVVKALWPPLSDVPGLLGGAAMMAVCIHGFLRGGRKFHLGIALWMGVTIFVQGYFVSRAIAHPERLPIPLSEHPWLEFGVGIVPFGIALDVGRHCGSGGGGGR